MMILRRLKVRCWFSFLPRGAVAIAAMRMKGAKDMLVRPMVPGMSVVWGEVR